MVKNLVQLNRHFIMCNSLKSAENSNLGQYPAKYRLHYCQKCMVFGRIWIWGTHLPFVKCRVPRKFSVAIGTHQGRKPLYQNSSNTRPSTARLSVFFHWRERWTYEQTPIEVLYGSGIVYKSNCRTIEYLTRFRWKLGYRYCPQKTYKHSKR